MEFAYTAAEQIFRDEIRRFLDDKLPSGIKHKVLNCISLERAEVMQWHHLLYEHGWVAPNWPKEHGGTGWSPVERHIFDDETAVAGAPLLVPFGLNMCGPVIIRYGTPAQKAFFLPRILSGEHVWCQGFSEPAAGSDLASLRTRALRGYDHYAVSGQKIWTTMAHWANWIFCLVRTDPGAGKKQAGISFLLIDLKSPGITVRRIATLDGEAEFNEVFFDDVKVPVENLVGTENDGWNCAKFLLTHERVGEARIGIAKRGLARLKSIAASETSDGKKLITEQRWRDRIAAIEIELMALEVTKLRVGSSIGDGGSMNAAASLLKIKGTELLQRLSALLMEAMGPRATVSDLAAHASLRGGFANIEYATPLMKAYLDSRKLTIYGGANEIQRNIIARSALGL